MKLQPLYDLQEEINRIYVAGSKLSAGDPRLQKHIPIFNKLGEKVPVFAKIATCLDELLNAEKDTSAQKLISLSILLYSVLYTQGETTEEGLKLSSQIPTIELDDLATDNSYLEIKPIIEALTNTGSGRYEIVMEAHNRNALTDSRLYQYLDSALGDKYSSLGYNLANTIIPNIGVAILPILLRNFKIENTRVQILRFLAISNIHFEGLDDLCFQVLQSNITSMRVAAIQHFMLNPSHEDLLISLLDDKKYEVLKATCEGLALQRTKKSTNALLEAFIGNEDQTIEYAYKAGVKRLAFYLKMNYLMRNFSKKNLQKIW